MEFTKGAETDVSCHLTVRYEYLGGTFRFIANEIGCSYLRATSDNKDCKFSAASQIWEVILWYAQILGIDILNYAPQESSYDFLPVAVAFSRPKYAYCTNNMNFSFFEKVASDYQPVDPETVKFVVLSEGDIGADLSKIDWRQVMQ